MGYGLSEVCELLSLERDFVIHCLREHWIEPADPIQSVFDREDVARVRLIRELREEFGVNDEAVPIILRLIDQLHYFRNRIDDAMLARPREASFAGRAFDRG